MISVVDDDDSIRTATKSLLRSVGYEVEAFASADLFLKSGALRETECLILDIRMPGIDGFELQHLLKAEACGVPIIFVTAHDDETNRRKALEAGAQGVFHKPFDASSLLAAIQSALERQAAQDVNANPRREYTFRGPSARKIQILMIEDNPADVQLLRLALHDVQLYCELTVIDDGAAALAFVREQGESNGCAPELVVLDWYLPKASGLEVLEAISKNRAFCRVPVAVLSSRLSPQQAMKIEQFNVKLCTTKPSTLDEFMKIGMSLRTLIEAGWQRRSSEMLA